MSPRVQTTPPTDERASANIAPTRDPFIAVEPFQPKSSELVPYSLVRVYLPGKPGFGALSLARVKAAAWADREPQDRLVWAHSGLWNHQIVEIAGLDTTIVPMESPALAHFACGDAGPVHVIVQSPTGQLYSTLAYAHRPLSRSPFAQS